MNFEIFMSYVLILFVISFIYVIFITVDEIMTFIIKMLLLNNPKPNRTTMNITEVHKFLEVTRAANEFDFDLYNKMSTKDLKNRFRTKVKKAHPDCGGNTEEFIRVRKAYDILLPYTTF